MVIAAKNESVVRQALEELLERLEGREVETQAALEGIRREKTEVRSALR